MNSDTLESNYLDLPLESFSTTAPSIESNLENRNHQIQTSTAQMIDTNTTQSHHSLDLNNDPIEYIPNELDDSNIQGKLVKLNYTLYCFSLIFIL